MTTKIADDYEYIRARMEEIKAERVQAPVEYEMQTAVERYMGSGGCESATLKVSDLPYLGFDIYAPFTPEG